MLENISIDTKKHIENIITFDHLTHAYMVVAKENDIAYDTAIYFAKEIIKNGGGVVADNLMIVEGEGSNLNIKVENIDMLRERLMKKPLSGEYMVAVIKGAEKMNPQSQNKLLKILEEPVIGVVIILSTAVEEALLPTIKSRCNIIRAKSLPYSNQKNYININTNDYELSEEYLKVVDAAKKMISGAMIGNAYYELKPFIDDIIRKEVGKDVLIKALDICEMMIRNLILYNCNVIDSIEGEYGFYEKIKNANIKLLVQSILKIENAKNSIYKDMSRANAIKLLALDIIDLEENN